MWDHLPVYQRLVPTYPALVRTVGPLSSQPDSWGQLVFGRRYVASALISSRS